VFESGGGDSSAAWEKLAPEVRQRCAGQTVRYDRAGLGTSDLAPAPYRIDNEASVLERVLDVRDVRGPVVLVAHSYGGFVATLVAASDARVAGVVLVDANLSGFFDDAEVARLLAKYSPQYEALTAAKPDLARVLVPLMKRMPETAQRMREVTFPLAIPTIDIIPERSWGEGDEETLAMRRVHAEFVGASANREEVFASGSGHYIMRDRPDLVLDAVARMVLRVRRR